MCGPDQPGAAPARLPTTGSLASTGAPANTGQALAALHAALSYLASIDATALTVAEQAECLLGLERAESARIAARSSVLTAFSAARGYTDDGHGTERSWLRWQARITSPAAGAAVAWARRLAAHPAVHDALAREAISASWAREMCDWSDLLPEHARGGADEILLAAAGAGAGLADLAGLAEEIRQRTATPDQDDDADEPGGRSVRLDLHYRGAGQLRGDLTPRCAAAVQAVLDALGKKRGPEDTRNQAQRDHDALEDACTRLIAAGCLPDRMGQPTQIQLITTLDQLLGLPGADDATSFPGPGPLATPGDACDAQIVPVVTGHADHDRLATTLSQPGTGPADQMSAAYARELALRNAIALLSGPAGLASRLRAATLTGPAASISLPLDIGIATDTIPPYLRRAVILRDQHCSFPGCQQRPAACQVHHIIPISEGGPTSLTNMILMCRFHHLIAIHQWGWKLILNADGTKTAISPDGNRALHSHSPPKAA